MWIVNEHSEPDSGHWELSVVKDDNHHGIISHGWFGADKIMVFSSGCPCHDKACPLLVARYREMAEWLATNLNESKDNERGAIWSVDNSPFLKAEAERDRVCSEFFDEFGGKFPFFEG